MLVTSLETLFNVSFYDHVCIPVLPKDTSKQCQGWAKPADGKPFAWNLYRWGMYNEFARRCEQKMKELDGTIPKVAGLLRMLEELDDQKQANEDWTKSEHWQTTKQVHDNVTKYLL